MGVGNSPLRADPAGDLPQCQVDGVDANRVSADRMDLAVTGDRLAPRLIGGPLSGQPTALEVDVDVTLRVAVAGYLPAVADRVPATADQPVGQ